jgi:hypothetical protein
MHLQVCGGEEKGRNTRTPAGLAGPGLGVARARAHDMRMNSPPKSGLKPRRPAASFCRLFLLQVRV